MTNPQPDMRIEKGFVGLIQRWFGISRGTARAIIGFAVVSITMNACTQFAISTVQLSAVMGGQADQSHAAQLWRDKQDKTLDTIAHAVAPRR